MNASFNNNVLNLQGNQIKILLKNLKNFSNKNYFHTKPMNNNQFNIFNTLINPVTQQDQVKENKDLNFGKL